MSDEFSKRERGLPSKDVRYAQGHDTNPHAVVDSRWAPARRPRMTKTACTQERKAPAFKQHTYTHPDFDVVAYQGSRVELQCRWCGHRWKEPR